MENNNKWSAFHFYLLQGINQNTDEKQFEDKIVQAFGELGWKEYLKNIERRRTLRVGSQNRIEPDLLFKTDDSKPVFVVEVKRPSIHINSQHHGQLFSYMRQLKLDYGLLIGSEIQIFYDGKLKQSQEPTLIEIIPLNTKSKKGDCFVELFDKSRFSFDKLEKFVQGQKAKQDLREHIQDTSFLDSVTRLIKNSLQDQYAPEVIDEVFGELEVKLICQDEQETCQSTIKSWEASTSPKPNQNQAIDCKLVPQQPTEDGMKIGKYVQKLFEKLETQKNLTSQEIQNLLDKDYSKKVFNINYPVLRRKIEGGEIKLPRYYKKIYRFLGEDYYLTSEWFKRSWKNVKDWEKKMSAQLK